MELDKDRHGDVRVLRRVIHLRNNTKILNFPLPPDRCERRIFPSQHTSTRPPILDLRCRQLSRLPIAASHERILRQMSSDHLASEPLQTRAFVALTSRERLPRGNLVESTAESTIYSLLLL